MCNFFTSMNLAACILCMYLSTVWLKLFHLCCQHLTCTDAYFDFDVVMSQIKAMAEDVQPLLSEVRDSGLLKEAENLTRSLTLATDDLRWILPNSFPYITPLPLTKWWYFFMETRFIASLSLSLSLTPLTIVNLTFSSEEHIHPSWHRRTLSWFKSPFTV